MNLRFLLFLFCCLWVIFAQYSLLSMAKNIGDMAQNAVVQGRMILQLRMELLEMQLHRIEPGEKHYLPSDRQDQRLRKI